MVCQEQEKDGSNYNLYTDGLKIYTTINSRMQQYAEEAVQEHVAEYLQPRFFKEKKAERQLHIQISSLMRRLRLS